MTEAPKRGRKPRVQTDVDAVIAAAKVVPDPVPGDNGKALARIVAFFKDQHPEAWEALRLCPLQHGVDEMAALLDG